MDSSRHPPAATLVVVTGAARTLGLQRVHMSIARHVVAALGGGGAAVDVCMNIFVRNEASAFHPAATLGDECPVAAALAAGIAALAPRWLNLLASGDCASYATLPGAVLPCHNSSSWLQLAWVDQCLRTAADGATARAYEYVALVRPDYYFARPLPVAWLRREAARGAVLTDCCQRKPGGDQFLFFSRALYDGWWKARVRHALSGKIFDRCCPENFIYRKELNLGVRVVQAFGVYAGIARSATEVWVRMNTTLAGAASVDSTAFSEHEGQLKRRAVVQAAYANRSRAAGIAARARDAACAAAAARLRNDSSGADGVARAARRIAANRAIRDQ